jgi:hypothetical protein
MGAYALDGKASWGRMNSCLVCVHSVARVLPVQAAAGHEASRRIGLSALNIAIFAMSCEWRRREVGMSLR